MLNAQDEKVLDLIEKSLILLTNEKFSSHPFLKKNNLTINNISNVKNVMHYCVTVDVAGLSAIDIAEIIQKNDNKADFSLALIHKINGFSCSNSEYEDFLDCFYNEIKCFFDTHFIAKNIIEYNPIDFYFIGEFGGALNRLF